MKFRVTAGLVLVLAGKHFSIAQQPGERNPLIQLSGSIRELTNRVSPAIVEISRTRSVDARVIGIDSQADLVLIRIEGNGFLR